MRTYSIRKPLRQLAPPTPKQTKKSSMVLFFDEVEVSEEEKPRNPELVVIGIFYLIIMAFLIYSYERASPLLANKNYPFLKFKPNYTFVPEE